MLSSEKIFSLSRNMPGSDDASFILGTHFTGGKPANKKKVKKSKKKSIENRTLNPSFSFFGGIGGAEMQMQQSMDILGGKAKPKTKKPKAKKPKTKKPKASGKTGEMSKPVYKKYLKNLTAERLYKIARAKGLDVYTKKDGRTVYVKKATIIKKLCDLKHGK